MQKAGTKVILGLLFGIFGSALASGASVFNFDSDPVGQGTTFTDTNNGIAATFSTSSAGGFLVDSAGYPSSFKTLSGNVLGDPGLLEISNLALKITFSSTITSISLNFAVNAFSPTPFTLNAFLNANDPFGFVTATDSIPANYSFPEGTISFSAPQFNSVLLSTTAPYFAIDNVTVTASAVPEPETLPLFVIASTAIWLLRRSLLSR